MLSLRELRLIDALHGGFPLVDRPYAAVAAQLDMTEPEVIAALSHLLAQGVLTRLGPLFQIERAGGQFVLAAMQVPHDRFQAVADQVNAFPEVAHNYRREHALNLWFVVAASSPKEATNALARIEALTGPTERGAPPATDGGPRRSMLLGQRLHGPGPHQSFQRNFHGLRLRSRTSVWRSS